MAAETLESLIAKKDAIESTLDGFEKWLIFFGVLVAIGVMGESVYGLRTWWNNRKLHATEQAIDGLRQAEIADARRGAAEATATAKGFESQIADANARAKTAEAQVATAMATSADAVSRVAAADARSAEASAKAEGFRADIATANESAAKASAQAAEAQLALERFKAPRTPSREQQQQMIALLSRFPDTPYELAVTPTPEAIGLVTTVDTVLRSSTWTYKDSAKKDLRSVFTLPSGSKVEQQFVSGVVIALTKALLAKNQAALDALGEAFKLASIDITGVLLKDDDPSPDSIHIVIGTK